MKVHHLGIIVRDLYKSIKIYTRLGYKLSNDIFVDTIQNNRLAFMSLQNEMTVELIEPINETSSVYGFKDGYHHICYEAEPGEDVVHCFKQMKVGKIFTKSILAPALNYREVVFACLQNGLFIEFILTNEYNEHALDVE